MTVRIDTFAEHDLPTVLELCAAEGWPSFPEDPDRALRALTAPGVTTVVARDRGQIVGFAQLLSDGVLQAYLAALVVVASRRGAGIGIQLIESAVELAGGSRVDLLTDDAATGFYDRLPHRRKHGYRLYPPLDEPLTDP
ncbi:MAG TPA: GNAT family N-acetyltransferase [Acidimicrobiales bacterium]|nr:GNAT family N-acetyltransferase [Acidimicrobiales bacterium]